jgi:hypothetical protein
VLDPVDQLEVEVQVAPEEVDGYEQVLPSVGERFRRARAFVEPGLDVGDVLPEGAHALARDLLAHQVADEEPEQGIALERRERDRRRGVLPERLGSEVELGPGNTYIIEPGHDAWVVGDERFVGFEIEQQAAEDYARD